MVTVTGPAKNEAWGSETGGRGVFAPEAAARPQFTALEIQGVREGVNGVRTALPARCYHDESIYRYEVENVLKKNWLCVGRWDWAEKAGDYFTTRMFGEPIIIARDRGGDLHALINVCQHRWSQLVPDGSGNAKLFVCPFHSWTYDLDGKLRGVSVHAIPHFDKQTCRLPSLRLEVWEGFIFINFDPDAQPLAPQLAGIGDIISRYCLADYRSVGRYDYDTDWNYKLSFETGYEAYHHEGTHRDILGNTAQYYAPIATGEIWGAYGGSHPPEHDHAKTDYPYGYPAWFTPDDERDYNERSIFIGIYPGLIMYLNTNQVTYIVTEHQGATANRAVSATAIAGWAFDRPDAQRLIEEHVGRVGYVQDQDSAGCRLLQQGLTSSYNKKSAIHPLESQLSHYYNWMLGQYLK